MRVSELLNKPCAPRGRLLVVLAGVCIGIAATWPVTLRGDALYWGDVLLYFLPSLEFVQHSLGAGRLPLWNPFVLCGQPLVGNPQASLLYPTTAALCSLDVNRFLALSSLLHVLIAWAGTYRYLRLLRLSRMSSIFGASTFVGGSAILSRLQFPTMVQAIAWMPWVLWAARRTAASPTASRAAGLAVVTALCILAGHPQMAYVGAVLAVATACAHAFRRTSDRRYRARVFLAVMGAMVGGAALSAAFWMPALQTLAHSSRSSLSLAKSSRFVLQPQHFLTMIWPGYFGDPATGDYWATGNMWEPALYIGAPQLALALYGLGLWRRDTRVPYHGLVSGVGLWLAFGAWGGLYAVAYYVVPGMEGFHDPARFCIPATLGLSCLSAVGLEALRRRVPRGVLLAGIAGSIAWLLVWTSRLTPTMVGRELEYRARLASVGGGHRVYTAMRQDLWRRYVRYDDYGADSGRYVHELTDTVSPNLGMRYGIEEAGGYEPVPLNGPTEYEAAARHSIAARSPVVRQILTGMDARFVLIPLGLRYAHPALEPLGTRGNLVFRQREPSERAWVVFRARHIPTTERAVAAIADPRSDVRREAITGGATPVPPRAPGDDGPEPVVAHAGPKSTQRMRFAVGPLARTGLLVVAVSAAPGWRARVDGADAVLVTANAAFMGVVVPPGRRKVDIEYRPSSFALGLYVSLLSLGCLMARLSARPCLRQGTLCGTE